MSKEKEVVVNEYDEAADEEERIFPEDQSDEDAVEDLMNDMLSEVKYV